MLGDAFSPYLIGALADAFKPYLKHHDIQPGLVNEGLLFEAVLSQTPSRTPSFGPPIMLCGLLDLSFQNKLLFRKIVVLHA